MIYLNPSNMQSAGARLIQQILREMGHRCLRSRRRPGIAWGPGIDKITQLNRLHAAGIPCIPFTEDIGQARSWIVDGREVVCRRLINSHSGHGIVLATNFDQLVAAPLYTKYIKKGAEYRVHVWDDEILIFQKKMKKRNWEGERNTQIRNLDNGYVFGTRFEIQEEVSTTMRDIARRAVTALDRHSGAVDIIWNNRERQAYVLEVNTTPGLSPSTARAYAAAIIRQLNLLEEE
jgi:glutathione synthase/RimK-type ligase-like ATP-grasp enzyme